MRAIEYRRTGDPSVLTLVERPDPEPGPGEARVRIHRSGVNPTDWKSRRGAGSVGVGRPVDSPPTPVPSWPGTVASVAAGVDAAGAIRTGWDAGLPLHHLPPDRPAEAHAAVEAEVVGTVLIDVRS